MAISLSGKGQNFCLDAILSSKTIAVMWHYILPSGILIRPSAGLGFEYIIDTVIQNK
jgi:hypothetical protein